MRIHVGGTGWMWRMIGAGVLVVLMKTPVSDVPFLNPFYDAVNAVVGDESYINAFGELPGRTTSEQVRIQTHLAYVEDVLRQQGVDHLTPDKRKQRLALLDYLKEYRETGIFPQRQDRYAKRRPCFIDDAGNICAVGYLLEQTAGRDLAEQINEQYQYAYLWDMKNDDLGEWVDGSGFTLRELAMIQPAYDWLYAPLVPNGQTPCVIDFEDFVAFAQAFDSKEGDSNYNAEADRNVDGVINFPDFISFAQVFGFGASCYNVEGAVAQTDLGLKDVSLSFVELDERWNTTTDSLGQYVIPKVPWGIFHLVPQKPGYIFVPDTLEVTTRWRNSVGQNFEAIPLQPLLVDRTNIRN